MVTFSVSEYFHVRENKVEVVLTQEDGHIQRFFRFLKVNFKDWAAKAMLERRRVCGSRGSSGRRRFRLG
jgi:hypothetical protein